MKIGIVSDIHADIKSLKLALDILQREGVDRVVCAGDLVERGPDGDAVVQLIRERNISCVMGNHDEFAPDNQKWLRENTDPNHPEARKRLLNEDTIVYLRSLPRELRYILEGLRVLVVHGTPTRNTEYLFPRSPQSRFETIARESEADIIIYGHTHEPTQAKFLNVRFFNPGSVNAKSEMGHGSHTCATLTLPDCTFQVFSISTGEQVVLPYIK